jgi:hypothetical protein
MRRHEMNDETKSIFKSDRQVTAVVRDEAGLTIHVRGSGAVSLAFSSLSQAVKDAAMGYGLEVRLTRAAALEANEKTGKPATAEEKYTAIKKLANHYATGTESWTMASGPRDGWMNSDNLALAEALSAGFELDLEVAKEKVKAMSASEREALRVDDEVKPWLDEVYAKRVGAAKVDTKGLLAKLKG